MTEPTVLPARRQVLGDERDVWLVGAGPSTQRATMELARRGVTVSMANLMEVFERARRFDWVLVSGLPPGEMVVAAEQLRSRGQRVVLDTAGAAVLQRALGQSWMGIECVVVGPAHSAARDSLLLRARDVVVVALALVALAPVFTLLALLVKRSSPGPVFYATRVVGRDGRTFVWRKFRSMRLAAPDDDERRREKYRAFVNEPVPTIATGSGSLKVIDESRVTTIGRVIRRHSLDELPQLWNVLRGDMTLVGPRPCLPYEYELQAPWHRLRYQVTPGLSGPWQVYGRSKVTVDEMAVIDYCYGRARSFWLDARIILRTFAVVITGDGGR